jgi:hypothetical protein
MTDFGLARCKMDLNVVTHVTICIVVTFGLAKYWLIRRSCRYMALEYATSGKLTEKSDAFSFGVALFELITGQKHVDALRPLGERALSTR